MYKGSINGAIKKGLEASAASNRQASSAFEMGRKRREEYIQRKRGRLESASSSDLRNTATTLTDASRIAEYAASVLTESPADVVEAVRHLRRLASQKDGIYMNDIVSTGVIPKFVQFLSLDDFPKLQFESVWLLTNIASGDSLQTSAVVQAGAIEPLLRLLKSSQLEVQEQSVWALGNISGDCNEYRQYIIDLNGIEQLVELAQNSDKLGLIKNCIWCISNLCRYSNKEVLFSHIQPHLPFLQQILSYNVLDVVSDACWAFSFLTDSPANIKKEVMSYINSKQLMLFILYTNSHLQCPALRIAGNIVSGDKDDTQRMIDAGLINVLMRIFPYAQDIQKKEILWIISNVAAGTPKQIKVLIDCGLIRDLIHIINTEIDILQIEALWGISNAINGGMEEQIRYIVEKQVIPPLVQSLPRVTSVVLKNHILVSLYRILKVGDHMKQHCKMEKNPYLVLFLEEEGDERVRDCMKIDNNDIQEVCRHILKRLDTEENPDGLTLPNI